MCFLSLVSFSQGVLENDTIKYNNSTLNIPNEIVTDKQEAGHLAQLNAEEIIFQENKGQIIDTDGELRPDVLFTTHKNGLTAYLKTNGISYVFEAVNKRELELGCAAMAKHDLFS
jgi:hypothetical protein